MNAFVIRDAASTFTRISKRKARQLWGKSTLAFCPVKLRPGFPWAPHCTYPAGCDEYHTTDFDGNVAAFEYYNCTGNETGTYTAFYIVT